MQSPQFAYSDAVLGGPSDGVDIAQGVASGFMVGVAGTVRVITEFQGYQRDNAAGAPFNTVTLTVPANVIIPLRIRKLYSTGTTATGIILFF
jgi:hypothetical protein